MNIHTNGRTAKSRGFTMIELVVVMAILSILATAAVPLTTKLINSKSRSATESEMRSLADGVAEYFRDTGRLPTNLDALLVDPGFAGWTGPYIGVASQDKVAGAAGHNFDGWSRAYELAIAGDRFTIRSVGADSQSGTADDIRLDLDVTFIRRQTTLSELAIINQAVSLYNAQYMVTAPLPANWRTALNRLVARGFIPAGTTYLRDGWNQNYVADPSNRTPVVKITSVNLR